jgi:signal peptidase I
MGWLKNILHHFGWIIIIIGSVALVSLIRCFAFTSCLIPTDGMAPALYSGERIIVNLWSYGLRQPFLSLMDYSRLREKRPGYGDVIVFNNPLSSIEQIDRRELFISRCIARPGDTVIVDSAYTMLTRQQWEVARHDSAARARLTFIVVPGKGVKVDVTDRNRTLLMNTLILHEGHDACIKNNTLYVDGAPTTRCVFTKDYYWVLSDYMRNTCDSRLFGFLPHDHILGRACCVWFSKDPRQGPLSGYRYSRFFHRVK